MLNRMRDLAVQSVNASNDAEARGAANNEITELKGEIGRITQQTKFGSQALLDGSFGLTNSKTGANVAAATVTLTAGDTFSFTVAWFHTVQLMAPTSVPAAAAEYRAHATGTTARSHRSATRNQSPAAAALVTAANRLIRTA